MRKCKKTSTIALLLMIVLVLSGCGKAAPVTEIPLGDGLPVWELDGEHTVEELSDNAKDQGLIGIYATDDERADVYVYSFPKEKGVTLEEFGQQRAKEHNVFRNMLTDRDVPVAVLNYYDVVEDAPSIIQAYIYEADDSFVEVRTAFKTESVPFGSGDLSIRMIREYAVQEEKDSALIFDEVCQTENDRLPTLRIRQFSKDDFPADVIEPELLESVSDEEYTALAEDGWTREEIVTLYDECYDLLKGEVTSRNGLDHAFIGYVDEGIFKTKAVIEDGADYIMLCAEAEASKFQHVTNALIDAIEKN